MAELENLRAAVIEKQELITNTLPELAYEEVVRLMAELSFLITTLDQAQAIEEGSCNRIILAELEKDSRGAFNKAEAVLKTTETYQNFRGLLGLKQSTSRALSLARLHARYLLSIRAVGTDSEEDMVE